MLIKDRVALITGGARIGQAVSRALAERGAHVALTYLSSKKRIQVAASDVKSRGRRSIVLKANLTLEKDLADIIPKVEDEFGRLDILVNMASTYERIPSRRLNLRVWKQSIDANLKHVYHLSLEASRLMKKNGGGRIINFSDWTAASGRPRYKDLIPYYAAKAGVIGLTEVLALELAPNILVNAIAPGPIMPPRAGISAKENQEVIRATPLRKWGGAEEIAKAVLFLIETDFVTGECIRLDGGRHLY